jgi:hypothetical protein
LIHSSTDTANLLDISLADFLFPSLDRGYIKLYTKPVCKT